MGNSVITLADLEYALKLVGRSKFGYLFVSAPATDEEIEKLRKSLEDHKTK